MLRRARKTKRINQKRNYPDFGGLNDGLLNASGGMMRKYFVPALLTTALMFSSHAVYGQAKKGAVPAGDAKAGEELFQQRCFQCHSVTEGEVRVGPSLYHVTKGPKPRKTPAGIHEILTNGKGKMPSFKEILTEKDMDDLIAYVKSL